MKQEYMEMIAEITQNIKGLRENLPEVTDEELSVLSHKLTQLDLSNTKQDEVMSLQEAFSRLAYEVNETMLRLNEYCDELKNNVEEMHTHTTAVKAYAVAHNTR